MINFSQTRALAIDSEFENSQQNCVPHPNKPKERLNLPDYLQDLNFKLLKVQANLRTKQFS